MALGDFPAGEGPFGFDPPGTTPHVAATRPVALLYDLASRRTLLDAHGNALSMHPVDQATRLTIAVALRALPSAPDTGLDYERLYAATPLEFEAVADDEVRLRLRPAVDRGDIRIESIFARRVRWRVLLLVEYTNLRTSREEKARGDRAA